MNILVTGGCGFIGSAVCRHLVQNSNANVINLDALTYAAEPRSLASIEDHPNYTFVEGNINNMNLIYDLLTGYDISAVMHLAAESHVDRSIDAPEIFLTTNIMGTYCLLQACRRHLVKRRKATEGFRFLHVSTDEVYGDLSESDAAFTETNAYKPSSPYSASKAASDHLVRAWGRTFDVPVVITNCSNNYGPYQFPEKLIPLMIISAISGDELPVYGDGENIRDWLHVEDLCEGLELVLNKGELGQTYNIGGNSQRQNIEIVELICKTLDEIVPRKDGIGYSDQIRFVEDRLGHDRRYAVCCEKIEKDLGWQPRHSFEKGLRQTILWYLENRSWWEPLIKRKTA